jgi:hypothetical protein|tara:strand:- start:15 stop:224 length:210 start_codon:yes stop_codon:yes gene_type:complete
MNWKYIFTPDVGIELVSELASVSISLPVGVETSAEEALELARISVTGTIELEDGTTVESVEEVADAETV